MERIDDPSNPQHSGMVTLYHLDDDRFMLTHYCAVNNQPRMRALAYSPESRTLAFEFLDVTNLQNSVEGHMRGLAFKFLDDDHVTAAWTFQPKQKEAFTETFQLTRIR